MYTTTLRRRVENPTHDQIAHFATWLLIELFREKLSTQNTNLARYRNLPCEDLNGNLKRSIAALESIVERFLLHYVIIGSKVFLSCKDSFSDTELQRLLKDAKFPSYYNIPDFSLEINMRKVYWSEGDNESRPIEITIPWY